ncbi:MAG: ATP-binding protein [Planctomycetota bacterium]|nr:ATP-binding protein [Planctomycetota bacterium]
MKERCSVLLITPDLLTANARELMAAHFSISTATSLDKAFKIFGHEALDAVVFCCRNESDQSQSQVLADFLDGTPLLVLADQALPADHSDLMCLNNNLDGQVLITLIRASIDAHRARNSLEAARKEIQGTYYSVAHDLGAPVRAIDGFVRLLMESLGDKMTADQRRFEGFVTDGCRQLQEMLQSLLVLSRVRTRGEEFAETDCRAAFTTALRQLTPAIEESRAQITNEELPIVQADELQLQMLFFNLLENAIKFRSDEAPVIHVGYKHAETEHIFSFKDNGIGIKPEFFERIFAPFQQLHPRHKFPGTGMGLPICKRIIERHGGRIWAESTPGVGSTFSFSIPADSA